MDDLHSDSTTDDEETVAQPANCRKPKAPPKAPLSKNTIAAILRNPERHNFVPQTKPSIRPDGGTVVVYQVSKDNRYDYRCDAYDPWKMVNTKVLKSHAVDLVKRYTWHKKLADGSISKKFVRQAYELPNLPDGSTHYVLVEYVGDHTIHQPRPHGNSKKNQLPLVRTCPSVLRTVEQNPNELPSKTYKRLVNNPDVSNEDELVLKPRNLKQVENTQVRERLKGRLGHDSLYNAIEVSYDLAEFVKEFKILPNLSVVMSHPELLREINDLLANNDDLTLPFVLHYDTTFNMGDFYVSTLIFRHCYFQKRPAIPAVFLIHDSKSTEAHRELFRHVGAVIPKLLDPSARVPLVTDRESAIKAAVTAELPGATMVFCWNHLKRNAQEWLKGRGAKQADHKVYVECIDELLKKPTLEAYEERKGELCQQWDPEFLNYFEKNLHQDIVKGSGRWIIMRLQLFNNISGITNNPSEGFNTVMKRLTDWRELDVDKMILTLFYLTNFYIREVRRGKSGLGTFQLIPELSNAADASLLQTDDLINANPENILEMVSSRIRAETQQQSNLDDEHPVNDEEPKDTSDAHVDDTTTARARTALNERRVVNVPELGVFTVKGTSGAVRNVVLFPKRSCTCGVPNCYHIVACLMAVGSTFEDPKKKTLKLNQLLARNRPRGQKKSGRKCGDVPAATVVFEAAPTSSSAANIQTETVAEDVRTEEPTGSAEGKVKNETENDIRTDDPESLPKCNLDNVPFKGDYDEDADYNAEEEEEPHCKKRRCVEDNEGIIDVDDSAAVDKSSPVWVPLPHDILTQYHRQQILSITSWLGETVIDASMAHFKSHFPNVGGLQHAIPDKHRRWAAVDERVGFVQILHLPAHWVCISSNLPQLDLTPVSEKDDEYIVYVFDSLHEFRISSDLLQTIAEYVKSPKKKLVVRVLNVQQQNDASSCGPLSIAFADALCRGLNPVDLLFDPAKLREHLCRMFELPSFERFPAKKRKVAFPIAPKATRKAKLYCLCRNVDNNDFGETMIRCDACKEWFHEECVREYLPKTDTKKTSWKCPACKP